MLSASISPKPLASGAPKVDEAALCRCSAHKFGGSSLADAGRYQAVRALLSNHDNAHVVVVSAMQGVTDALVALTAAACGGQEWIAAWTALRARHLETAAALDVDAHAGLQALLDRDFDALHDALAELATAREPEVAIAMARLHGLGEVWSAHFLHELMGGEAAGWARLDAREVLVVHPGELGVAVDWDASRALLAQWRAHHAQENVIVTGFIARDAHGRATTLGRNGSDYSGAIFAALFDAGQLTIWTDVDGVLSADPRLMPDAVCLPNRSTARHRTSPAAASPILMPILSAALPLRHSLELEQEAACVEQAVSSALDAGVHTADLAPAGRAVDTAAATAAVLENLQTHCYVAELRD